MRDTVSNLDDPTTVSIKLGTQPFGSVLLPKNLTLGETRWFRSGDQTPDKIGRLFKRRVNRACSVIVTDVVKDPEGQVLHILVDYLQ